MIPCTGVYKTHKHTHTHNTYPRTSKPPKYDNRIVGGSLIVDFISSYLQNVFYLFFVYIHCINLVEYAFQFFTVVLLAILLLSFSPFSSSYHFYTWLIFSTYFQYSDVASNAWPAFGLYAVHAFESSPECLNGVSLVNSTQRRKDRHGKKTKSHGIT